MIDAAICELVPIVGVRRACAAAGEAQARWYRRHRQSPPAPRPTRAPARQPRALSDAERAELRAVLNSPDHVDEAPATVYAKLLDAGIYRGSISTMYRVLREHGEVGERRRHATHPATKKPELLATEPNQCWSWDITKLLGPEKWTYFYLLLPGGQDDDGGDSGGDDGWWLCCRRGWSCCRGGWSGCRYSAVTSVTAARVAFSSTMFLWSA